MDRTTLWMLRGAILAVALYFGWTTYVASVAAIVQLNQRANGCEQELARMKGAQK